MGIYVRAQGVSLTHPFARLSDPAGFEDHPGASPATSLISAGLHRGRSLVQNVEVTPANGQICLLP